VQRPSAGERWSRYLRSQTVQQRPIAPVLVLTVATLLLTPLIDESVPGRITLVGLVGIAALTALSRTGASRHIRIAATVAVTISTLAVAASGLPSAAPVDVDWRQIAAQVMFTGLLLITPTVVVLRLLLRPRITLDTLAGALTAYLQIGLFFAALYRLIDIVDHGSFFVEGAPPSPATYQYFSFITLTTVGYGDFTPATPIGQTLASFEAIFGQVFLVTVVALTVSNLGRELPHRRGLHPDADGPASGNPAGDELGSGDPAGDEPATGDRPDGGAPD